jgi:hypothetical protein
MTPIINGNVPPIAIHFLLDSWSAAELPGTKLPRRERFGQFVEITDLQRLHGHTPSPVDTVNHWRIAVFRLDCTHARDSLEELEKTDSLNHRT